MLGLPRHLLGMAVLACAVVFCSSNSARRNSAPRENAHTNLELEKATTTPLPDLTTKEFRMPLCALPKKGPLICYAICVLLLNDNGKCNPNNICSCTIKQSTFPAASFLGSLFGK